MKVVIVGMGYVGLAAAIGFAEAGHRVTGIDKDKKKLSLLRKSRVPIYEPGMEALLKRHAKSGSLRFDSEIGDETASADIAFICVGTPQAEDGSVDLSQVLACAEEIGASLNKRPCRLKPLVVATKSTVAAGSSARILSVLRAKTDRDVDIASNPEFMREGDALHDFLVPDRVVIGTHSAHACDVLSEVYRPILEAAARENPSKGRLLLMDPTSAELTKYAANAMLALRITFINEIAGLCESLGADIDHIREGIGSDYRIGVHFLSPGPGFGGSCFPKDLQALLKTGREHGHPLLTLATTVEANKHRKQALLLKIRNHFKIDPHAPTPLRGKRFALWGLSFKAHTDDIRESVSLELIENLRALGASIAVHDYKAMEKAEKAIGKLVDFAQDPIHACIRADALVIATDWPQYKEIDKARVFESLNEPLIFDARNLFDPHEMGSNGWTYYSIGRAPRLPRAAPTPAQ